MSARTSHSRRRCHTRPGEGSSNCVAVSKKKTIGHTVVSIGIVHPNVFFGAYIHCVRKQKTFAFIQSNRAFWGNLARKIRVFITNKFSDSRTLFVWKEHKDTLDHPTSINDHILLKTCQQYASACSKQTLARVHACPNVAHLKHARRPYGHEQGVGSAGSKVFIDNCKIQVRHSIILTI
jgi:hypothetical protein